MSGTTRTANGESADNDAICGAPLASGEGVCKRRTEGGRCWQHADAGGEDGGEATAETPDGGELEAACETLAAALPSDALEQYASKRSVEGASPARTTALAVLGKISAGTEGYVGVFGACEVEGCERGSTGWAARTCSGHDADDLASDEESQDGGEVNADITDIDELSGAEARELLKKLS